MDVCAAWHRQPGRPKPVIDRPASNPLKVMAATAAAAGNVNPLAAAPVESEAALPSAVPPVVTVPDAGDSGIETAAAGLLEAGVGFIESLARDGATGSSSGNRLEQLLSGLFTRDGNTNRVALSIPLPESLSQERIASAISGLANALVSSLRGGKQ